MIIAKCHVKTANEELTLIIASCVKCCICVSCLRIPIKKEESIEQKSKGITIAQ